MLAGLSAEAKGLAFWQGGSFFGWRDLVVLITLSTVIIRGLLVRSITITVLLAESQIMLGALYVPQCAALLLRSARSPRFCTASGSV